MRFVDFGLALQLAALWFAFTQGGDATRVRAGAVVAVLIYVWRSGMLGALFGVVATHCCCCCPRVACCGRGVRGEEAPPRGERACGVLSDVGAAMAAFVLSALPSWTPPPPRPEPQVA